MTAVLAASALVAVIAVCELRLIWNRQTDRSRVIEELARAVGIAPAITVGRKLGWIQDGDVRSDGDTVSIRVRRRWRQRRS